MHSTHGIQLLHLLHCLPKTAQSASLQASGAGHSLQPARQEATTETNSSASLDMAEAVCSQQYEEHADPASCQVDRQHQHSQLSTEALNPTEESTGQEHLSGEEQKTIRDSIHSPHGSIPSVCAAVQANPAHSVWSMSASTSSSETGLPATSPSSLTVGSYMTADASLPGGLPGPMEHGEDAGGVTTFTVCSGSGRRCPEISCGVAIEMTQTFDPEQFVINHIPDNVLQHHRLTDYIVDVLDGGTSHSSLEQQHVHCCPASQQQQIPQSHSSQRSLLLLIVAILQPRFPAGSLKCTRLAVDLNMSSGIRCCHASSFHAMAVPSSDLLLPV